MDLVFWLIIVGTVIALVSSLVFYLAKNQTLKLNAARCAGVGLVVIVIALIYMVLEF